MKRVGWVRVGIAFVLLAGGAFGAVRWRGRAATGPDVPSLVLKKEPFVRQVQADGYLKAVKSTPLTAPPTVQGAQKIAWLAPDGSKVAKGDVVIRFDPSTLEKKLRDGKADQASADAKIDKEKILAGAAERGRARTADLSSSELDQTRAFQSTDPEIFSRNQIVESSIDEGLSTARMTHAADAKKIEDTLSKSKLELINIERKSATLNVTQAEAGLQGMVVHAPHDGIVVFAADWRGNLPHVGDSVFAGQVIANIPLLEQMEAEIYVLEADAGGLEVGTAAAVVLEAHPEAEFDGKIRRIDTLAKPRIREVPIQYFGVAVALARTDQSLMKPGERVRATLAVDRREALAVPRQAVFEKEGKTVTYRWQAGRYEAVPVKLGASTPGRVVIEEGLAEGDRIALRDPALPADKVMAPKDGDKGGGDKGPPAMGPGK